MIKDKLSPEDMLQMRSVQLTIGEFLKASERAAPDPKEQDDPDMNSDPLYPHAVTAVRNHGRASHGFLQRFFRISYVRADKLITRMETEGVIGPYEPGGYRRINKEVEK